jgi:hypothetical protein
VTDPAAAEPIFIAALGPEPLAAFPLPRGGTSGKIPVTSGTGGDTLFDAGDREICHDSGTVSGRRRSGPLEVPKFLRLDRQTPRRHFGAKRKFLFLLSGCDVHRH